MPIHWLIVRMPSATFLRLLLKLANVPSAPQISLPSRSGHISPSAAIFLAQFRSLSKDFSSFCTSATAVVELCSPCGEVPWNIVAISLRVLASSRATTLRVSVLNIWVFRKHMRLFSAFWNATFAETSISNPSTLDLRFLRGNHSFFPTTLRRSLRPSVNPRPGAR